MSTKVSLPQGTRDFGPETVRKRYFIFNTIRSVFELYGYQPLETPAMENLETLMGKYGEEGDKLIFRILNNGLNDPKNIDKAKTAFGNLLAGKNDKNLTERALKYDLTIPFARYVAMNHAQLNFPFKRYQIQPVWRADRPARGRYREFYQCDADVVGSASLINEAELAGIYARVFQKLNIPVFIKINSRKILAALAEACSEGANSGAPANITDITVAIDKLDKIGIEKVKEELFSKGLNESQVQIIQQYLQIDGSNEEKLAKLKELFGASPVGAKGIEELEFLLKFPEKHYQQALQIDLTLARGLNYYTGIIFEIKARDVQMGSIGGGGRYDDLTGLFGVPGIPGVGISFGVDRIYDVMEESGLFPRELATGTRVLFFNLGQNESRTAFNLMETLRDKGISSELYHEQAKMDKQFRYAERKNIPFAVIIGSKELETRTCVLKDLTKKQQQEIPFESLANFSFI
jgi:histidyl-tRNA synthetase